MRPRPNRVIGCPTQALLWLVWGFFVLPFCAVPLSAQTQTVPIDTSRVIASNFFGTTANSFLWDQQHSALVPIEPNGPPVIITGQVVCPNADLVNGKCQSGVYWMLYQLVSVPPRLKVTINNLVGFNFSGTNTFGVLNCGAGNTTALCTNLPAPVIAAFNMSAIGGPNTLTFDVAAVSFPSSPFTFFVQVANPAFSGLSSITLSANPLPNFPYLYYLPHVVVGGGYVTKITAAGTSPLGANGQINFIDQSGHFIRQESLVLPPGGTFWYQTEEEDRYYPLTVSWAVLGSDQPIGVNEIFEYIAPGNDQWTISNTIGFGAAAPMTEFTIPEEVEPAPPGVSIGKTMGIAIANTTDKTAGVTVKLYDRYATFIATTNLTIPPYGQIAFNPQTTLPVISDSYPNGNFLGSLTFSSNQPVAVLALQDTYGPFASIPVFPGKAK
jgi:hypothetical protein